MSARSLLRKGATGALTLGALVLAPPALADEPRGQEETVTRHEFTFRAEASCGDASRFEASFAARSHGLELVPGGETSPIQVVLVERAQATHAELSIRLADGRVVTRSLEAPTCEEALQAISFVTALALDPRAVDPLPVASSAPERSESASGEVPKRAREATADRSRAGGRRVEGEFRVAFGALARGTLGTAPSPLLGASFTVEVEAGTRNFPRPLVRGLVHYEIAPEHREPEGVARFERFAGSLDVCPVVVVAASVQIRPCATTTLGWLVARGEAERASYESARPSWDLGGSLSATVPLGSRLLWMTRLSAEFPLIRDEFRFDQRVFHRVGAVVGTASTGLAVRFP